MEAGTGGIVMATTNPLMFYELMLQQGADYTLERAAEKATLNHPQTKKLHKTIMAEMKKASKTSAPKTLARKPRE